MKVQCVKCKAVEDITGENLALLAHMISMYNTRPKASDYTAVLSIIKGDCTDREKHVFSFDESFYKEIDDMRNQYEEFVERQNICNGDSLKIDDEVDKYLSDIKELDAKAREIEDKIDKLRGDKDNKIKEIESIDTSISDITSKLENLTGIKDIKIWS